VRGAGITAELLTKAGLRIVIIVEEGQLKSSSDFKQREPEAYASLYREAAGRQTKDKGITISARPQRGRHHHRQLDQLLPHTTAPRSSTGKANLAWPTTNSQALAPYVQQAEDPAQHQPLAR